VAVTDRVEAARASAARNFQVYGTLPSYRAMLDREGAAGPADVVIAGDAPAVREQLANLADAGATDLLAVPFRVDGDSEAVERTRALLVEVAARDAGG